MRLAVQNAFVKFSSPLEGVELNPYLDVRGLLTVGIGCLIDPPENYPGLPWVFADGSAAPAAEVLAQLRSLKAQQGLKNYRATDPLVLAATKIRLTASGVLDLVSQRLLADEVWLRKYLPQIDTWPADAQVFAFSTAWAVGAGWPVEFENCTRLLNSNPPQFALAAAHAPDANHPGHLLPAAADISTANNAGIVPRNAANELCLRNAQAVIDDLGRGAHQLSADVLYWPEEAIA